LTGADPEELRLSPLFAELSRKDLRRLALTMSERPFSAGTAVTTEGEVGVGFFLIVEGEASVTVGGKEAWRLGPGDHFGEIALIVEGARTASVTAETELRCYAMSSWEFRKLAETNAAFSWKLLQAMARRLLKLEQLQLES
jgi:CRP/FNR family transcriptional regulator, cyclic AMP receptor protein